MRTTRPSKPENKKRILSTGDDERRRRVCTWIVLMLLEKEGVGRQLLTVSPAAAAAAFSLVHVYLFYYCPGKGCQLQIELQHGCEGLNWAKVSVSTKY
jgi:hypothetical protein